VAVSKLRLRLRIPLGHECLSVVSVVCCQVEVAVSGRSLVQRIATDCGVSEEDREAWTMRKPLPTRRWRVTRKTIFMLLNLSTLALYFDITGLCNV
jgi:hypothetical protein